MRKPPRSPHRTGDIASRPSYKGFRIRPLLPTGHSMLRRLRSEEGMGLVELLAAMTVLSIALLALLAGYGSAFVSLRLASQKTTASQLAASQMELYRALPYGNI